MACGCGNSGCSGDPCGFAPRSTQFTIETPQRFSHSLARLLIKPADRLRDLFTRFGLRPYIVRMVKTRWTGGRRSVGEEAVIGEPSRLLPTPLVMDLQAIAEVVSPIGTDEQGGCLVREISGCYTEEQLRGLDNADGAPVPADQSFYWEIEFLRADGVASERRRFNVAAVTAYDADEFAWQVRLERARPDRTRGGAPR